MRLTTISEITGLPMPKKLQESCGEDSCADQCELHGDNGCKDCAVQECMTKLYELEKLEVLAEELNIDDVQFIKLFNKEGTQIYERNIYEKRADNDDILVAHTKPTDDNNIYTMSIIGNMTPVGITKLIENLLRELALRTEQTAVELALLIITKITAADLKKKAKGDRCTTCRHDCNEDCGHPEKTNEDYDKEGMNNIDGEPIKEVTNEESNMCADSTIIGNECN